jgi:hypothetical protein
VCIDTSFPSLSHIVFEFPNSLANEGLQLGDCPLKVLPLCDYQLVCRESDAKGWCALSRKELLSFVGYLEDLVNIHKDANLALIK